MKPIVKTVDRFRNMFGWANRILRIDLSNMQIAVRETAPYVPDLLGASFPAARLRGQG